MSEIARAMVTRWGMSQEVGLLALSGNEDGNFLEQGSVGSATRPYSEETAHAIDQATRRIVDESYINALELLRSNRERLDALAQALLREESLDEAQVREATGLPKRPAVESRSRRIDNHLFALGAIIPVLPFIFLSGLTAVMINHARIGVEPGAGTGQAHGHPRRANEAYEPRRLLQPLDAAAERGPYVEHRVAVIAEVIATVLASTKLGQRAQTVVGEECLIDEGGAPDAQRSV